MHARASLRRQFALFSCLALLGLAPGAHAGIFRAYLSVSGSDANNCTLPTPCRLLPAALVAVNDGGEIWMLDSGNFNTATVHIDKSVTILAVTGALASVVSVGQDGLRMDAPGIVVTLRNLSFSNLGGSRGAWLVQGAALTVENCRFLGLSGGAVVISAGNSKLTVKDSVFRENLIGIEVEVAAEVVVDRAQIIDSGVRGIRMNDGSKLSLSNSIVTGTGDMAVMIQAMTAGGVASAVIDRSTIVNNFGVGVYSWAQGAGSNVRVTVTRSTLSGNSYGALSYGSGSTSTMVLDDTTISHNNTGGVYQAGTGIIKTRGNNVFSMNTLDVQGGPLTPLAGQ